MTDFTSKIEVTNGKTGADKFYWANTNEYQNLSPSTWTFLQKAMVESDAAIRRIASGKHNDGLTITWGATVDGVIGKSSSVNGVSYGELAKLQRYFYKMGEEFVKAAESKAPEKDKKHGHK